MFSFIKKIINLSKDVDKYDAFMEISFQNFLSYKSKKYSGTFFDIFVYSDLPDKNLITCITKGLSGFILGNYNKNQRIEISLTMIKGNFKEKFINLIFEISDELLNKRNIVDDFNSVVFSRLDDFIQKNNSENHLILVNGVWLPKHLSSFVSAVDGYRFDVFEILIVRDDEKLLLKENVQLFINKTIEGKINLLDRVV